MRNQRGPGAALLRAARAVLCALAFGGLVQATVAAASSPPGGTCGASWGDVRVSRDGEAWGWLPAGEAVRPGERVRTGSLSSARLDLPRGGVALLLSEGTTLQLRPVDSGAGAVAVSIESGEAHGEFTGGPSSPPLELSSPDGSRVHLALLGEQPTHFRLVAVQGGVDVSVLDGEARLGGQGMALSLRAGEHALVGRGMVVEHGPLLPAPSFTTPSPDERFYCPGLVVGLGWEKVAGASAYRVEVGRDARFESPVFAEATARTRSVFVAPAPARYLLRVTARDARGLPGRPSAPLPLFCEPAPPEDLLLAPEPEAVLRSVALPVPRLELRWAPLEGAARYRVAVSRNAGLRSPEAKVFNATKPRLEVAGLEEGAYLWGVWAEESGQPLFLEPRRFTVRKAVTGPKKVRATLRKRGE